MVLLASTTVTDNGTEEAVTAVPAPVLYIVGVEPAEAPILIVKVTPVVTLTSIVSFPEEDPVYPESVLLHVID